MIERIKEALSNVDKACAAGVIGDRKKFNFSRFLRSVGNRVTQGRTLTPNQIAYLAQIEEDCSQEKFDQALEWARSYSDDLREVAVICAEYYENLPHQGYFSDVRKKVLSNPKGHILSKVDFDRMCCNKYAIKVLEETKRKPKYHVGQLVEIRKSNRLDMSPSNVQGSGIYKLHRDAARGKVLAMVVKVNARPVYRTATGAKVYSIIPVGGAKSLFACERDLKKVR